MAELPFQVTSYSVALERDLIQVSVGMSHEPDEKWSYRDAAGHVHRFEGSELPTLEWVVTDTYWCAECRDDHEEGEYRCKVCAQPVNPRYRTVGPTTKAIPGRTRIVLEPRDSPNFEISSEELEEIKRDGEEAVERIKQSRGYFNFQSGA